MLFLYLLCSQLFRVFELSHRSAIVWRYSVQRCRPSLDTFVHNYVRDDASSFLKFRFLDIKKMARCWFFCCLIHIFICVPCAPQCLVVLCCSPSVRRLCAQPVLLVCSTTCSKLTHFNVIKYIITFSNARREERKEERALGRWGGAGREVGR